MGGKVVPRMAWKTPFVDRMMKPKVLFPVLVLLTVLRAVWVAAHEVSPQEVYFWMCSRHLAPGFFDGPAGTALLVRAFGESFDMARLFWPVLGLFCSWAAWLFVRRIYDEVVAGWCVVFLNVLPVFNFAAMTVGPLLPALVSVLTGLVFARMAWDGKKGWWAVAGVFFALALLFRYEAVLVPTGLVFFALSSERRRTGGDLVGLGAMVVLCALALLPALRWNAALEWIPIAGGTWKTAWEFRAGPFLSGMGDFFEAFSAPVAVGLAAALAWLVQDARRHGRAVFLLAGCGCVWGWGIYLLLRGENAVPTAFLGVVPLLAFGLFLIRKIRVGSVLSGCAAVLALLMSCFLLWSLGRGSWKAMATELHAAARDLPVAAEGAGFFIAEDADLAAVLGYYLPGGGGYPAVFVPESPDLSNQFGIWPSYADFVESDKVVDEYFTEQKGVNPFMGRNAIYIGHDLPQTIKGAFQEVQSLRKIPAPDGRERTIFLCLGYQTLPL